MMVEAKGHAVMNPAGNEGVLDGGKDLAAGWHYMGAGLIGRAPIHFLVVMETAFKDFFAGSCKDFIWNFTADCIFHRKTSFER